MDILKDFNITEQQKKFADLFFFNNCKDKKLCAIQAGYAENSADITSTLLLKNYNVKKYLAYLQKENPKTREEVIAELCKKVEKLSKSTKNEQIKLKCFETLLKVQGAFITPAQLLASMTEPQFEMLLENFNKSKK